MTRSVRPNQQLSSVWCLALGVLVLSALGVAAPASAQLSRITNSIGVLEPGGIMRGTDVSHDPSRDLFFTVTGNGPIFGIFTNGAGHVLTGPIVIADGSLGWGHFPRVTYSRDIMNGQGGFLVTWHSNPGNGPTNFVFARIISVVVPGGLASPIYQLSDGAQRGSYHETGPAMAYSATSQRFLVAWKTNDAGIHGRLVGVNGAPIGGQIAIENPGGSRDPSLAWNPRTNEFGAASSAYDGGAHVNFRRVRATDGGVSARIVFGYSGGTFATALKVNGYDHYYVLAWAVHPGILSVRLDPFGNLLTPMPQFITGGLGFDQSLDIAYNSESGTFLAVSSQLSSAEIGGVEMTGIGLPNSSGVSVTNGARTGSFYPMVIGRQGTNQWAISYSRDFRGATLQFVNTTSLGGGAPPRGPVTPSGGCTTADPFVSIGGGTCINGGWVPGRVTPPPAPAPIPDPGIPTGCTTPDPFVSIGGGTCRNGGWVPWR